MSTENSVFATIGKIIGKLDELRNNSSGKAALANLRNSIGRPLSETIDIWPIVFEQMPDSFLGRNGRLTNEERAILTTLQIYALHQQSRTESVNKRSEKGQWDNIGISLKFLRTGSETVAIDRRFNTMITSSSFEELTHHLRQLLRLLKAKNPEITVNYAQLGNDLYWYLRNKEEKVRLDWAKAFYSRREESDKGED
ncbi:type I-E CRISPR-associated protein Cse2/CasB [Tetragenococcus halophilus]|uniref:Type I-E CRISPR-associated protein Cse2/CasB n=1 Tax=Tetragenococcus halophilus TaxID=51669 RepID=A0AB37D764_TETHA|nr:type I-E CRISPR-associated protein Cse2/CasB [Tetragenococcus halophilus]MCO8286207.1 type I-E CRISPR-associated protein Cse2/CasB [Tetragenococcus halophilus]NWO00127.1 type I-E CRISPR-associated protein Cse2/CasB [Tetragenococcus halophilus]QGP77462.1 type I-E CRISPR-associated protein Cse2/CasB [Tetragenococcus halophilus]WJS83139.1 type I-E CRISPR-associated protein Cse2/CasB [Tetragenococcus halophilus]